MLISRQIVGRIYYKVGPRRLITVGLVGVAVISFAFMLVDQGTNLWWIRAIMFVRGVCMAFSFVPLQAATYANISPTDTGRATAIYTTQRQVSAAVGVAALATVWITRTKSLTTGAVGAPELANAQVAAFHDASFVAALVAVVGALAALLIRDTDAAATLRRPGTAPTASSESEAAAAH